MSLKLRWSDDFARMDALSASVLDGEGQSASAPPARVLAGRNAFASFQVAVGPIGKGQTVRVVPADLVGEGKATVDAGQFRCLCALVPADDGKWYPEICVPQNVPGGSTAKFRELNRLPDTVYAGFWVDVFVRLTPRPAPTAARSRCWWTRKSWLFPWS